MLSAPAFAAEAPVDNSSTALVKPASSANGLHMMAQVVADDAAEKKKAEDKDAADDNTIVVEGIRASLESAIGVKRRADNIVDSITAEGIGRFPDLNLGESIQRIAGVQLIRDEFRSGKVAIRGLPGLTKVQINGNDLASPDFSGSFSFGIFESSIVSGVDVQKTPTVRMDAGGIGGIINLKTYRPLDFKDNFHLFVQAKGQYEQLSGALIPDLGLSAGFKNAEGTFGAYISIGYQEREFRSDAARISQYRTLDAAGGRLSAAQVAADPNAAVYIPVNFRYVSRKITGDRLSASGGLEWQVNDNLNFGLTGIFSRSNSEQPLSQMTVFPNGPRRFNQGVDFIINDTLDTGNIGTTATSIRYISPAVQVQSRILDDEFETWSLTFDGKWEKGPLTVFGSLHHTRGFRDHYLAQFVSRRDSRIESTRAIIDNGLVLDLDIGANNPYDFSIFLNESPGEVGTFGYSLTNTASRDDNLLARIFAGSESFLRNEKQSAAKVDVIWELDDFPVFSSVEFGARYRELNQINQQFRFRNDNGVDLSPLDNSFFGPSFFTEGQGFLGGQVRNQGLLVPDIGRVIAAVLPANFTQGDADNGFVLDRRGLIYNPEGGGLFDNTQDIFALYGLINFDFDMGPIGVRGNIGGRYVNTSRTSDTKTATQALDANGEFIRDAMGEIQTNNMGTQRIAVSVDTKFSHFLPQANMIFDVTDNFVLRVSYSETMNRPDPNQLQAGNFSFFSNADGERVLRFFSEKSGLVPFTAKGVDLAFEWYNRPGGVVNGGFFSKKIAGTIIVLPNFCPTSLIGFENALQPLGVAPDGFCREGGVDTGLRVVASQRINSLDEYSISGFEIGTTQNLDFLPGFLGNFGFTANYTYIDASESAVPDNLNPGQFLPQTNISKHSFNLIAYYETKRFGIRLANNYRSKFLAAGGGTFFGDQRLVDDRMQWDLSGSFNITDQFRIGFEALNLTDEDRFEYQGVKTRFRNLSKEGRTFTLSVSYSY
ncbi:MAG: TonB-dependent receptor [Sphingorhabdus sp.]